MPCYLVALSLGPVQSLIGAARRTRDLWCGSWLLSEASRAAARALHQEHPGCLIFPCPKNPDEELKPQNEPGDKANIANVIRAEVQVPDEGAARGFCATAKQAAEQRIGELGELALKRLGSSSKDMRLDVWQAQAGDILESFAAWVQVDELNYTDAREHLDATLAARKATRDFRPSQLPDSLRSQGLPKSSLDGAMETVLPRKPEALIRNKLRLSEGEQLDALGAIKRLAGKVEQFTAYARIAADPWIESLESEQQQKLCKHYEPLVGKELATRTQGNQGIYKSLPFDGLLLYASRLERELQKAAQENNEDARAKLDALKALKDCLGKITPSEGKPVPYAVILKADGDRMGELLSKATCADQSRRISQCLHEFASGVPKLVRDHRGHAIYAGGDDVLALLPLQSAIACADKLRQSFAQILASEGECMSVPSEELPTLSVGLGIGHVMEPLSALRRRAEQAESLAKGDDADTPRNALGIQLGIRSGGEHTWRGRWDDQPAQDGLQRLIEAYKDKELPSRVAYDIGAIDLRLAWLRSDNNDAARGMRFAEVGRILQRARTQAGQESIPKGLQELVGELARRMPLHDLANTLIIARWLAARKASELGERE